MKLKGVNFYENNFHVLAYSPEVFEGKSIAEVFEYYSIQMKRKCKVGLSAKQLNHSTYGMYYVIKYGATGFHGRGFSHVDVLFSYEARNFKLSCISEKNITIRLFRM